MYEDMKDFIRRCGACQRHENINSRDAMPLTNNLQIELFDVWGIDYMRLFPKSKSYEYILVAVDYVSKWVEAMPCKAANAKNSKKGMGISLQEMPCHWPTTSRLSSSMFGELITWDHFQNRRTMNTSWWKLTMSPNGLKPCHRELLMQRTPRRCLKRQYFHDSEFQEWWLVMESLTSLTRTFTTTC